MTDIHSVLITGANAGIGYETARQMAARPEIEKIILACRNEAKAVAAKAALETETGRKIFEILLIDVSDVASSRAAADAMSGPVDAVILNAGGMGGTAPNRLTRDGVTNVFALNLLGHTALVERLLERQLVTSTVLLAGSEAARGIPKLGVAKPELETASVAEFTAIATGEKYDDKTNPMAVYGTIKLIGAMWMGAMARKHGHIRFVTMSPGSTTGTNALDHLPFMMRVLSKYVFGALMPLMGMMHRVEDAAKRFVDGVTDAKYASGRFYGSGEGAPTGPVIDQAGIDAIFENSRIQDDVYRVMRQFG